MNNSTNYKAVHNVTCDYGHEVHVFCGASCPACIQEFLKLTDFEMVIMMQTFDENKSPAEIAAVLRIPTDPVVAAMKRMGKAGLLQQVTAVN